MRRFPALPCVALLLLLLCCLASSSCAVVAHDASPPMQVVINPDGTASIKPVAASAATAASVSGTGGSGMPEGVILPGMGSGSVDASAGLVPVWLVEKERKAAEEARAKQEEEARLERERVELQRQREQEEQARLAREAAEAAANEAAAREKAEAEEQAAQRAREEQERQQNEQQQQQQQQQQQSQQQQPPSDSPPQSEPAPPPNDEADEAAQEAAREHADAIQAAAAAAYAASQQLVNPDAAGPGTVSLRDPAESLLQSLERAAFFRELLPHNAWQFVQQGRPFVILVLCRCALDDDLDIPRLENLLVDAQGMHHKFAFLWVRSPAREQFSILNTYGLSGDAPALVIDNIPIGQHIEKYAFDPSKLRRPRHPQAPEEIVQFLTDFLAAPSPLPLILRSQQSVTTDEPDYLTDRGRVLDVVGNSFQRAVLDNDDTHVLVALLSPTCPGCHAARPVLDSLAQRLGWSRRDVLVVTLDRTANDLPMVLRFASYPAIFLFPAGAANRRMDTAADGGEEPMRRGERGSRGWRAPLDYSAEQRAGVPQVACAAPLNVDDLEKWVQERTGGSLAGGGIGMGMLGGGAQSHMSHDDAQSSQQSEQEQHASAPDSSHTHQHEPHSAQDHSSSTDGAQQAGAAM